MAFSTSLLRLLGGFSLSLGRVGGRLLSAEDLHVQRLLVQAGYQVHYEPRAAVWHHVPASRLTQQWFLDRAYSEGLSGAVMRVMLEQLPHQRRVRMAIRSLIQLLMHPKEWAGGWLRADEASRFANRCQVRRRLGMIRGLLAHDSSSTTNGSDRRSAKTGSPNGRRL